MRKHRKRLLLAIVFLVFALVLALLLLPRDEPKYQGRYLSEWMGVLVAPTKEPPATYLPKQKAARQAVEQIGANAVPCFVAWLSHETPAWKASLNRNLPLALQQHEGKTAVWAGNSPDIIQRHYKGLVKEADAKAFWALRPESTADKVIALVA